MKDRLTAEQSEYLIRLGIREDKASGEKELKRLPEHVLNGTPMATGEKWGWFKCFTLSDLLSLLPKQLTYPTANRLEILYPFTDAGEVLVRYATLVGSAIETDFSAPDLIDCLYELLIWCVKEKFVKL